jgi:hypothetical protein
LRNASHCRFVVTAMATQQSARSNSSTLAVRYRLWVACSMTCSAATLSAGSNMKSRVAALLSYEAPGPPTAVLRPRGSHGCMPFRSATSAPPSTATMVRQAKSLGTCGIHAVSMHTDSAHSMSVATSRPCTPCHRALPQSPRRRASVVQLRLRQYVDAGHQVLERRAGRRGQRQDLHRRRSAGRGRGHRHSRYGGGDDPMWDIFLGKS